MVQSWQVFLFQQICIFLTFFLAALSEPVPRNTLSLEPSARIEVLETPARISTAPQFESSLASAINFAASSSTVDPSLLSSSAALSTMRPVLTPDLNQLTTPPLSLHVSNTAFSQSATGDVDSTMTSVDNDRASHERQNVSGADDKLCGADDNLFGADDNLFGAGDNIFVADDRDDGVDPADDDHPGDDDDMGIDPSQVTTDAYQAYRERDEDSSDDSSNDEEDSDHDMNITPKKIMPQNRIEDGPPQQPAAEKVPSTAPAAKKVPSTVPAAKKIPPTAPTPDRPRKRQRPSTSSEDEDDQDDQEDHEDHEGEEDEDVGEDEDELVYASIWEPTSFNEDVSTEYIFFLDDNSSF